MEYYSKTKEEANILALSFIRMQTQPHLSIKCRNTMHPDRTPHYHFTPTQLTSTQPNLPFSSPNPRGHPLSLCLLLIFSYLDSILGVDWNGWMAECIDYTDIQFGQREDKFYSTQPNPSNAQHYFVNIPTFDSFDLCCPMTRCPFFG